MPRNNRPIIIGAAVLGALALGLTLLMMMTGRNTGGPPPGPPPPQPVVKQVVATRAIPPRTLITRDMLTEETTEKVAPGAVTDINDAVGKISSVQINPRAPIQNTSYTTSLPRILPANFSIPTGYRGVAIYVDPTSTAAGLVDVGDRIDVIANHKLKLEKQPTEGTEQTLEGSSDIVTGRTIAQDLLVLAVDKSLSAPTPTPIPAPGSVPAPAAAPPPPPPPPPAGTVVKTRVLLAATPQVAERLVAANDSGTLHITIRNPNEHFQMQIPAAVEFPSRLVSRPKQSYIDQRAAAADARRERQAQARLAERETRRNMEPSPVFPTQATPMTSKQPTVSPMQPIMGGALPQPAAPSGSEVTVIRGTEKTRVIVPGR